MNQTWISPYSLRFRRAASWRKRDGDVSTGVLICVQNSQGLKGFSACTYTDSQSLFFKQAVVHANEDLKMREENKSCQQIFSNFRLENNFFLDLNSDDYLQNISNFRYAKIKVKGTVDESSRVRNLIQEFPHLAFRLDFNSQANNDQLEQFFRTWTDFDLKSLQYVEDPCVYDTQTWERWSRRLPLAFDAAGFSREELFHPSLFKDKHTPFQFLILKPSWQEAGSWALWAVEKNLKITVTSAMDHPVGQVHALKEAARIDKKFPGVLQASGLRTGFLYQENAWANQIENETPYISFAQGLGIGFDELFQNEKWVLCE